MNFSSILASFLLICVTLAGGGVVFWHLQSTYQAELRVSKEMIKKLEKQVAEKKRVEYLGPDGQAGYDKLRKDYQTLYNEAVLFKQSDEYILYQIHVAEADKDFKKAKDLTDLLKTRNPQSRYLASVDPKATQMAEPQVAQPPPVQTNNIPAQPPSMPMTAEAKARIKREILRYRLEAHAHPSENLAKLIQESAAQTGDAGLHNELRSLNAGVRRLVQLQTDAFNTNSRSPVYIQSLKTKWRKSQLSSGEIELVPLVHLELRNRSASAIGKLNLRAVFYDPFDNRDYTNHQRSTTPMNDNIAPNTSKMIALNGLMGVKANGNLNAAQLEQLLKPHTLFVDIYVLGLGSGEVRLATVPIRNNVE